MRVDHGCWLVQLAYTSPFVAAGRYFPTKTGLVIGLVDAGFGCGAFVFDQVGVVVLMYPLPCTESGSCGWSWRRRGVMFWPPFWRLATNYAHGNLYNLPTHIMSYSLTQSTINGTHTHTHTRTH